MFRDVRTEAVLLCPATEQVTGLNVLTRIHAHEFRVVTTELASELEEILTGLLSVIGALHRTL